MARTRHQTTRTRTRTSKKYWATILAYVVSLPLLAVYLGISYTEGGELGLAINSSLGILLLLALGVMSVPALFWDATRLRERRTHWQPEWWKYNGATLGVPAVAYFGLNFAGVELAGIAALLVFMVVSYAASAYYIYNRHRFIGVP